MTSENSIRPDKSLPLLQERPPILIPGWIRLTGRLFKGIVRFWLNRRSSRLESQVLTIVHEVRKCHTRQELETLIGKPLYALSGDSYRIAGFQPDRVEIYNHLGLHIELLFKAGKYCSTIVGVDPTVWGIATATEPFGILPPPPTE
jgi:hypothetical protein